MVKPGPFPILQLNLADIFANSAFVQSTPLQPFPSFIKGTIIGFSLSVCKITTTLSSPGRVLVPLASLKKKYRQCCKRFRMLCYSAEKQPSNFTGFFNRICPSETFDNVLPRGNFGEKPRLILSRLDNLLTFL